MSFRRRGTIEILLEIIRESRLATNKTRLTNKVNLNYTSFNRYSEFLERKGFIMKIQPPPLPYRRRRNRTVKFYYVITNKGIELLNQIDHGLLSDFLSYRNLDIMEEISK